MAAEDCPSPAHHTTVQDVGRAVGSRVESFGRWLQKPRPVRKEGCRFGAVKGSGLLVGVCVVMVMSAVAMAALTRLTRDQLDRYELSDEIYGKYPVPRHLMWNLALVGFVATGVGIAAALFSLLASCCRSSWLLGLCMFFCVCAIVLSLGVVAYGAAAVIMEDKATDYRYQRLWKYNDDHNYRYVQSSDNAVYNYYHKVAHIWSAEVRRDGQNRDYDYDQANDYEDYGWYRDLTTVSSEKSTDNYAHLIEEYQQKETPRTSNVVIKNSNQSQTAQILSYMEDFLKEYNRLTDIYKAKVKEDREHRYLAQDCLAEREGCRYNHMQDLYRGLIAMGTTQALMALFVAIILGKTCCKCRRNKSRKVIVIMRDPALGTPSTDDISSLIQESHVEGSGLTVIPDGEKLVNCEENARLLQEVQA